MLDFVRLQLIENSTQIILRKHQQQIKVRISQDNWSRQSGPGGGGGGAVKVFKLQFHSLS